jgi:hypothetical protein
MAKRLNLIFISTITIIGISIIFFKFFLANKGLVIDDEAWFLLLIRDLPSGDAPTQFHKLFFNVFNGNIYKIRISYIFLEIISFLTFSTGLYYFLKNKYDLKKAHIFIFFTLTLIGYSIFSLPICNIPYYANLNKTLLPLSIGFFLFSIYKYNRSEKHLYLLYISGLIVGFQPFIMITTITIYLFFLLLIFFYFDQQKIKHCIYYCFGIITSISIYFVFIESPIHFWENEIIVNFKSYSSSNYTEKHGILPILRWLSVTIKYIIFNCTLPAIGIIGIRYLFPFLNHFQKRGFFFVVALTGVLFFYFEIIKGEHEYASMNLFIAAFIFSMIDVFIVNKKYKQIIPITLLIFILPLLLSIGTDVDYKIRATDYIGMYFPFIFILQLHLNKKKKLVFSIILTCYFINYTSMYFRTNWGHFQYSEQKTVVKSLGINQNLQLNELNISNLNQLKPFFNKNESIVVSDKNLNGTCYLLRLKMITYDFKLNPGKIIERLNTSYIGDTLKMIESTYSKFDSNFISDVQKLTPFKLTKTKNVGIHSILYFTREKGI